MRQYILLIDNYQAGAETYDFRIKNDGREIYSSTDCLVPGMEFVKLALIEALNNDPLE